MGTSYHSYVQKFENLENCLVSFAGSARTAAQIRDHKPSP
jgi:hypothetical protein